MCDARMDSSSADASVRSSRCDFSSMEEEEEEDWWEVVVALDSVHSVERGGMIVII